MNALRKSYNVRLFSAGMRNRYHFPRFWGLKNKILQFGCRCSRVLELGCFAKTLYFFPAEPQYFLSYDADWEGRLQRGRAQWADNCRVDLRYCSSTEHLTAVEPFDTIICMETLEHLPIRDIEAYFEYFRRMIGLYCFITMPVESGLFLPFKYIYKSLIGAVTPPYRLKESAAATFGYMKNVPRIETAHKGFDYRQCLRTICRFFDTFKIEGGHSFSWVAALFEPYHRYRGKT